MEGQKATAKRFGIDHSAVRMDRCLEGHGAVRLYHPAFRLFSLSLKSPLSCMCEHWLLMAASPVAKFTIPAFSSYPLGNACMMKGIRSSLTADVEKNDARTP